MIKINPKPFIDKQKEIDKLIRKVKSQRYRKRIAEFVIDLIYKRVKSGYGVTSDTSPAPSKTRLLALGETAFVNAKSVARARYIRQRKRANLGPFGTPSKSNLTFTGEMLESLTSKITGNGFIIDVKNTRRNKGNLTNKQVANHVSDNGRPWLALTLTEQRIVLKEYERIVRELTRGFR